MKALQLNAQYAVHQFNLNCSLGEYGIAPVKFTHVSEYEKDYK